MSINAQLTPNIISPGTCYPANAQLLLNFVAQNLVVTGLESDTFFSFGPSTPPTDAQSMPWIKTDAQYNLIGVYTYANGAWRGAPLPILPGSILDFFGTPSSIVAPFYNCNGQSISGPIGGALTTPNLQGLVTIGAGTNPKTGTNFVYGSNGGEEKHALIAAENGPHTHAPLTGTNFVTLGNGDQATNSGGQAGVVDATTGSSGNGTPHNNLQPYMALYKIIYWP